MISHGANDFFGATASCLPTGAFGDEDRFAQLLIRSMDTGEPALWFACLTAVGSIHASAALDVTSCGGDRCSECRRGGSRAFDGFADYQGHGTGPRNCRQQTQYSPTWDKRLLRYCTFLVVGSVQPSTSAVTTLVSDPAGRTVGLTCSPQRSGPGDPGTTCGLSQVRRCEMGRDSELQSSWLST